MLYLQRGQDFQVKIIIKQFLSITLLLLFSFSKYVDETPQADALS